MKRVGNIYFDIVPELFKDMNGSHDESTFRLFELRLFFRVSKELEDHRAGHHLTLTSILQAFKFGLELERFVDGTVEDLSWIANDSLGRFGQC